MLDESFRDVYTKFKLHFYQEVFSRFQNREASLTAVETFCMEIIMALEEPTINEFASFVNISSPNAAYKVNSLIQKGYVEKIRSDQDRREYHLRPTKKIYGLLQYQHRLSAHGDGTDQQTLHPGGGQAVGLLSPDRQQRTDAGSGAKWWYCVSGTGKKRNEKRPLCQSLNRSSKNGQ